MDSDEEYDLVITITDIFDIIERKQIWKNLKKDVANDLFNKLDIDKSGVVAVSAFINLLNSQLTDEDWETEFNSLHNNKISSKSEIIIQKLKFMKENKNITLDHKTIDDLNWIISTISGNDIFEPDYTQISNKDIDKEYLGFLAEITNLSRSKSDLKKTTLMGMKRTQIRISSGKLNELTKKMTLDVNLEKFRSKIELKEANLSASKDQIKNSLKQKEFSNDIIVKVTQQLEQVGDPNFNIFDLNEHVERKTLSYISNAIFQAADLDSMYDREIWNNFTKAITEGYSRDVPYHNDLHAADVLQTGYVIISQGNLKEKLKLQDVDIFAVLLAALCHDYKHPGYNNMFLVNTKASLAIRYNDSSPLENFHVAQTFKILMKPENNILESFSPEEYRLVRRRMIETILATDMANHGKALSTLKSKIDTFEIKNGKHTDRMIFEKNEAKTYENQQAVLSMCIHCADLSNPAKKEPINKKWVELVFIEFFKQGDEERKLGLPISMLCDRKTTHIAKSQIGFINFAVKPSYEALMNFTPEISAYMDNIVENLRRFENIVKDESKEVK